MKEKIAWAETHGVNAPDHARAIAAAEEAPDEEHECCKKAKACCPPKKPEPTPASGTHWLSVADLKGCGGKPVDALGVMSMPAAVVGKFVTLRADLPPAFDWLVPFDLSFPSRTSDVSTPPPNLG